MKRIIFIFIIFLSSFLIISQAKIDWIREEEKARDLFNQNKFDEAIILFREIILSSNNDILKREAYFWIAKAYMNINKLYLAEQNLEYYLLNYQKDGQNYAEALYQKGRLLFFQEEYQKAIEQLNLYITQYPNDILVSNAYYWIGESLYALGQFNDAEFYFDIVIKMYPKSNKVEACMYKLRLIEHKKSSLVLQNLLKWSQEQYLLTLNQFKIREKSLQQALEEYEKNKDKKLDTIEKEKYNQLQKENEELKKKNEILEEKNRELLNSFSDKDIQAKIKQLEYKEQLLKQKEEALKILEEELRLKEKQLNEK